jgi:hypothetical protein
MRTDSWRDVISAFSSCVWVTAFLTQIFCEHYNSIRSKTLWLGMEILPLYQSQ